MSVSSIQLEQDHEPLNEHTGTQPTLTSSSRHARQPRHPTAVAVGCRQVILAELQASDTNVDVLYLSVRPKSLASIVHQMRSYFVF